MSGSQDNSPEELSKPGPAQGMLLAAIAITLQKPSGKSLQKISYLLKTKKENQKENHTRNSITPSPVLAQSIRKRNICSCSGWLISLLNHTHGNNKAL